MKKIMFVFIAILCTTISCQKEGNEPLTPSLIPLNGHQAIDLGLSVRWATCNIGARTSADDGYYFSWGETSPKDYYNDTTYTFTGMEDVLLPEHDAAHVNWGSIWRMPTLEEYIELYEQCTWKWTSTNNSESWRQPGWKVTGPNGNSIFFPAVAERFEPNTYGWREEMGYYWSSTRLQSTESHQAYHLLFNSGSPYIRYVNTFRGYPIRAVCPLEEITK